VERPPKIFNLGERLTEFWPENRGRRRPRSTATSTYWARDETARLYLADLRLAERVGFGPENLAPINYLGPFSTAQNGRNAQNLSIRYKTGTAKEGTLRVTFPDAGPSIVSALAFSAAVRLTSNVFRDLACPGRFPFKSS